MLDVVKSYSEYIENLLVFYSQHSDPYSYFSLLPIRRFITDAFIKFIRGDENYAK
jgi:hypothetical protein